MSLGIYDKIGAEPAGLANCPLPVDMVKEQFTFAPAAAGTTLAQTKSGRSRLSQ